MAGAFDCGARVLHHGDQGIAVAFCGLAQGEIDFLCMGIADQEQGLAGDLATLHGSLHGVRLALPDLAVVGFGVRLNQHVQLCQHLG